MAAPGMAVADLRRSALAASAAMAKPAAKLAGCSQLFSVIIHTCTTIQDIKITPMHRDTHGAWRLRRSQAAEATSMPPPITTSKKRLGMV
jgi:hypothetical protein